MLRSFWKPAAMLLALSLLVAACADGTVDESPVDVSADDSESVSGEVNLDGSSTVGPLSEVAAELYMQENPDVRVTVAISGTGGGFEKFCIGETDANNSSRPIKDEEIEICEENGIGYDFVTVANDALAALVNNDFPVDCLTVDQINAIWDADSSVSTWGDVPDTDFPEDFASQPVQLYGPGTDSGTFDYWTEAINGEEGRIRNDYIDIGEDDNAAVTAVRGDGTAMGYVPYSYFQEAAGEVKALEIDNGDGCVEATPENVANETYAPLGRGLFVYFSDTAFARPEVLDFAEFYVDNAVEIAELAEFIALTDEQIETARSKIADLAG
ncbi:MAG: PstS family phosphate ABC transporter substrate-binding protein [Egibacteraceae bacterium]